MEYNNGKCLCPGPVQPLANFTCPPYQQTCSSDHFTCRNGLCVPRGWKCDGEDDCGDSSDETQCGTQTCPPNYFICDTTKCLPQYWRCDYDNDCVDGADEMNCPRQNCTEGQFTCRNGRCIAAKWKCDGENDCRDGSDEMNCEPAEPHTCKGSSCGVGGGGNVPECWLQMTSLLARSAASSAYPRRGTATATTTAETAATRPTARTTNVWTCSFRAGPRATSASTRPGFATGIKTVRTGETRRIARRRRRKVETSPISSFPRLSS
jgi:hypothetical protein